MESSRKTLLAKVVLMSLLLVVGVTGCTMDDDPYLRDDVITTTRRPTESEQRMYHRIRLDIIKSRLLRGLGMSKPPEIHRDTAIMLKGDSRSLPLPNYLHMKDMGIDANGPLVQPLRKFSRVIVFAELGSNSPCQVPNNIRRNYTPVSFKLPSDPSLVQRAMLQIKTGLKTKMTVWICFCTTPGNNNKNNSCSMQEMNNSNDNKIHPTVELQLRAANCQQVSSMSASGGNRSTLQVPMKSLKKGWSQIHLGDNWKSSVPGSPGSDKRLLFLLDDKLSITERIRPSLVLEVEKQMFQTKNYPLRGKRTVQPLELNECNLSNSSPCCRIGYWVDFKELGWSDWIVSPHGFYFHFCSGQCRHGIASILNRGNIAKNKNRRTWTCCLPRKTSPLKIVMLAGRSSLNHTLIPNFITDECTCISVPE